MTDAPQRVFRDREELTTRDLSASIEEALSASKFLIVICTKQLPLSAWCNREVETFIRLRGIDHVILVLVEGEPSTSFSPALLNYREMKTLENGEEQEVGREILGAELRPVRVKDPSFPGYAELNDAALLASLTKASLALLKKTEKYRIMAAMLGISYGDLKERDKERR